MPETKYDVPRVYDETLFKFFNEVAKIVNASTFSMQRMGSVRNIDISVQDNLNPEQYGFSTLYTAQRCSVGVDGYSVSIDRVNTNYGFDKLTINNHSNNSNQAGTKEANVSRVASLVSETFMAQADFVAPLYQNPGSFELLLQSHQRMIEQLQATVAKVGNEAASARLRLEEEYLERQRRAEEELQRRKSEMDISLDEARALVKQREEDIESRKKALDDRDHIHARRQLREQITEGIRDRLKDAIIPVKTSRIGWGAFALALVGALTLGALSLFSLTEFAAIVQAARVASLQSVKTTEDLGALSRSGSIEAWMLLARGFLAAVGSIAFLAYAIGWLKSIYHDQIRAHRELERYSIDLNRASWAVETIMEAKSDGTAIPDTLIAGLAHNLFGRENPNAPASQSDALGSLLRASARAKIGPSGAEFEVNSKGARKLADEIEG